MAEEILDAASQTAEALPDYAPELAAFHRAFYPELKEIVDSLPIGQRMRVLDVGCGDGFYLSLLADRLGPEGTLVGLDVNPAYLQLAKDTLAAKGHQCKVELVCGALDESPFNQRFDFVWCAQSLFSLPEPVAGMAQMRRLLRPGGMVAVLENDTLHQVLLPWPSALELAIRTAELQALRDESRQPSKFYVGRRLPAVFAEAGLEPLGFRSQTIDRQAPLDPDLEAFLQEYLRELRARVEPYTSDADFQQLEAFTDPEGEGFLLRDPSFTMTWINVLALGRVPLDSRSKANP